MQYIYDLIEKYEGDLMLNPVSEINCDDTEVRERMKEELLEIKSSDAVLNLKIKILLANLYAIDGNKTMFLSIKESEILDTLEIHWYCFWYSIKMLFRENNNACIPICDKIISFKDVIKSQKLVITALTNKALINTFNDNKDKALECLKEMDELMQDKQTQKFKFFRHFLMSNIYLYNTEYEESLKEIALCKKHKYTPYWIKDEIVSTEIRNYENLHQYENAIRVSKKMLKNTKKNQRSIYVDLGSLAKNYINANDIYNAELILNKVSIENDLKAYPELQKSYKIAHMMLFYEKGEYSKIIEYYHSCGEVIEGYGKGEGLLLHRLIIKSYIKTGKIEQAIKLVDDYHKKITEIHLKEKNKIHIDKEVKYNTAQKEQEIKHLKELDAFKTRFFSNITHDIRTPMSLVLAPLETLLKNTTEPKLVKSVKTAYSNAQKLENLLDQLLDLNKIEEGVLTPKYVYGDITAFCSNMIQQIETKNQVEYTSTISVAHSTCYFAEDAWYKILQNLLSNAIKFSGKRDKIMVTLSLENNYLKLVVQDQGIGISEADLPKIFDRFYQVDNADTKPYQGSGIGLSIVKEYVELLGGKVEVESSVRKGTCFTVSIPYKEVLKSEDISTTPIYNFTVKNSIDITENTVEETSEVTQKDSDIVDTILLVEDNEELRFFLREQLATQYHIIEAADGREGVQKASKYLPSIIISDIMMPELDGITLCKIVKETPQTNHIPVILLTAKTSIESELEGYNVKADGYIKKPFSVDILKSNIQSVIDNRAMMRKSIMNSIQKNIALNLELEDENDFIEKFRRTIHQHIFNKELNVNFIAKELNISRLTLLRKVQHYLGLSPKEVISNMRLNTAHLLISQGTYTVKSVAYKLGYPNLDAFYKSFKKQYGYTPASVKGKKK